MPELERPWGSYHYLDEGAGPLVVLLHPLAASGDIWRRLVDELSPSHRVVAPDARGHGRSTWDGSPFTVQDLAEDVAALIEHLGIGAARVVGLSLGGCTAVALSIRRPDLVIRLVLADTTADYGPDKEATWGERAERAVAVPRNRQLAFQVDRWFSDGFVESDPDEVRRVSDIFVATDSRAHAAACLALGSYSDERRLGEISSPTLVLVGDQDYATPPVMAKVLNAGIAGSRLEELSQTRHMSLIENPTARQLVAAHVGS